MALIQANFASACLKRSVQFTAIVPVDNSVPGFVATERKLPLKTLYLLHGFTANSASWFQSDSIGSFAARYNLAIIMPDAENHFYVDDFQRGDMYGEYIGRELVNYTRKIFPLSKKREDTIIGGFSMGGYGALRNGLKYNDVFGNVVAISSALLTSGLSDAAETPNPMGLTRGFYESVFGNLETASERDVDVAWLSEKLAGENAVFPDLYIACGKNDALVYENRRLHEHLKSLDIKHEYDENSGTHDSAFFIEHLARGLDRLPLDRLPEMRNPLWIDD